MNDDIEQELREIGTNFIRAADEIVRAREHAEYMERSRDEALQDLNYMRERAEKAEKGYEVIRQQLVNQNEELERISNNALFERVNYEQIIQERDALIDDLTTRIGVILLTAAG